MDKVERVSKLLEIADQDYATTAEVASTMKVLLDLVKKTKVELNSLLASSDSYNKKEVQVLKLAFRDLEKALKATITGASQDTSAKLSALLTREIESVKKLIPSLPPEFDPTELQNQIDVLMAYEPVKVTGISVRDLLEALEEDERLDASAIKNLPKLAKELHRQMGYNVALSSLLDVNLAGITSGQSISWNGVSWEPYTPAGGGGTPVWGEDLTPQGAGTAFTLAHTPVAGTVRLFRGGAYQSVVNGDYSITGDAITLTSALKSGEVLVADYSY